MNDKLTLFELTGSPNNVKARIALGYKKLNYDRRPLELDSFPGDRSQIAALSGQPRTPVLQHGEIVIFDSGGILRYLEANFPDSPRIFRDGYEEHGEIERWEMYARMQIGEAIGMLFGQALAKSADAGIVAKANEMLNERTAAFEDRLSSRNFLVGDHLTAADIACAAPLYLADMTAEKAEFSPIARFFFQNLRLGAQRERTRAWTRRVLAFDSVLGGR
ncbi:MAG: glutathione S-transferase family protein [Acidobacteriota bacterium]|nr:glutathione S-transferase family protein [Acidobacteriota bacterium]